LCCFPAACVLNFVADALIRICLLCLDQVLERLAIVNVQVVQLTAPLEVADYVRIVVNLIPFSVLSLSTLLVG
jgi:hypothetical protein